MIVQAGKDSSDSNSQYISPLHDAALFHTEIIKKA